MPDSQPPNIIRTSQRADTPPLELGYNIHVKGLVEKAGPKVPEAQFYIDVRPQTSIGLMWEDDLELLHADVHKKAVDWGMSNSQGIQLDSILATPRHDKLTKNNTYEYPAKTPDAWAVLEDVLKRF